MKSSQRATSAVDTRGFVYELAPYLQKQEWQLERLENQLAHANRQLAEARARRDELDEDFEHQMRSLRKWMYPNPNPQAYQRGLLYLTHLRSEMKKQDREIEVLLSEKELVRAQCIAQQLRLDGLLEHRANELQEYSGNRARLLAAEADRDWIGRALARASVQGGSV